jgi:hypothetical protein
MSETTQTEPQNKLADLYAKFKADFPKEAYSSDRSRGFALTSLKAQYIIERLNESVGFCNWRLDGKYQEIKDSEGELQGVLFEGHLVLFLKDFFSVDGNDAPQHIVPTIGYHEAFTTDNKGNKKFKLIGDVYKGARTDALSKGCSYLGIGNDMFKGKVSTDGVVAGSKPAAKSTVKKTTTKKPETFQGKKPNKPSDF